MKTIRSFRQTVPFLCLGFAALLWPSCGKREPEFIQGYVEGEFVYVSSALPGTVTSLEVSRGDMVEADAPLFSLDDTPEKAARDEAERRLAEARAKLEDAQKGKRPTEIAALEAQLKQAEAAEEFSKSELDRQQRLLMDARGATSRQDVDRARSLFHQDEQRVAQLEEELKTAQLGQREDQVAAARAQVKALEAALAQAEWNLSQKQQDAPAAGLVFDTLYRSGEWVPAGRPVVSLLPPPNIKVRAFVPEPLVGTLARGDTVSVHVDGLPDAFTGTISFISPKAEYTPPVIYSRESRRKLVFMIEAVFDPETAARLHPGQPVDVELSSAKTPSE